MNPLSDPVAFQSASGFLATMLGAICSWKAEQSGKDQDKFKSFVVWLENHNFNALKDRIFESEELQRDLNQWLRDDLEEIDQKLQIICDTIATVAKRIDGISSVVKSIGVDSAELSDQACAILKWFYSAGSDRYLVLHHPGMKPSPFRIMPIGGNARSIYPGESRFFEDDMKMLQNYDFIKLVDYSTRDQNPIYALTRAGASFAAQMSDEGMPDMDQSA